MQITKPLHNRYVLSCLDNETYVKYSTVYAGCKRCGVRGIYTFLGGTGLWGVAKEVAQGTVGQLLFTKKSTYINYNSIIFILPTFTFCTLK